MTVNFRRVLALALPALGVLAANPLYLLLDTAVIGRLGAGELAALAAGATVQSTVTTQLTFLSYGTTARSSRFYGADKTDRAIAEGVQATWVAVVVGVLLATLVWLFAHPIALFLTNDPATADMAVSWMRVAALAIPLTLIIMAGNGWLRGVQNTKLPFYLTLCGLVPGAVALPFLVARFGLVGSAVANVIGMGLTAAGFLWALIHVHKGSWRPDRKVIAQQLVLGRDLILRSLSFQVAFISAAAVAGRVSVAALAAHQVMLQLWNFLTLVLDSLAIAAQTLTGSALGTGRIDEARAVGEKVTRLSLWFALTLAGIFAVGGPLIRRLFTTDEAVLDAMAWPWWLLIAMIAAGGVLFALDGVLLGASDAAFLRTLTLSSVLLGFLPGIAIAYWAGTGLTGIWCGLAAMIVIRLAGDVWRFSSMRWARVDGAEG
ncbi:MULTISPECIES: MATE family efflux transporter [unclassified Corynebacterium]|uniref:MATE family efflux transporter n=1 Tax=unclassified Corynebacterium TaxID=2624378 RepID=UPI0021AA490E|nr:MULTISPECIES: MATE family efflux transporter [unclassified Corynebacterium]MCT1451362.1 MATE family efflux transporter [Corynebacterium sp. p3-SID1145]MCT1460630.1 MATE family efflux transporter [Corynebacterium sp. p3-SID1140]MDN8593738.1 MATE family efflux transporter [Corynebacterium sp. P4_F2]WKK55852.1 MATE family efflux transporter [Corynebacterium sp. P4-C1]WKK63260.1 MATE family efflux transporter [Corynebacterium sp. P8-C1]